MQNAQALLLILSSEEEDFDPAEVDGLLAWYDGREGKTLDGVEVIQWDPRAGTGLGSVARSVGPDDAGDYLEFNAASTESLAAFEDIANWTQLYRDGCVITGVCRLTNTTGQKTIFDTTVQNATSGRGISLGQNGVNLTARLSNGSGTFLFNLGYGPSFGGADAFTAGNWHTFEFGWEPGIGAYLKVDNRPPMVADTVGTPSSTNLTMWPVIGALTSGAGPLTYWWGGGIGQLLFAGPSAMLNRANLDSIQTVFADLYGATLDESEYTTGAASGTILVPTTRILTGGGNSFFKRGLSRADASSRGISLTAAGDAEVRDWGPLFRVYNATAESVALDVDGTTATLKSVVQGVTGTPRVCCIGDSRTAPTVGDTYVKRLKDRFGGDIALCGTVGSGDHIHEGHSGWDYGELFSGAASPITDGSGELDIASWHTAMGGAADIYVLWSDVNAFATQIASESTGEAGWQAIVDAEVGHIQDFITAVVAENADAIFVICTSPIYSKPAADYASYNGAFTAAGRAAVIDFIHRYWNPAIVSEFGSSEGSDIYVCDLHTAVDGTRAPTGDPFHFNTLAGYGHDFIERRIAAVISDAA